MNKHAPLAFFLFIFYHAHAMEIVKQDSLIPCDDICYLNNIPQEILNRIAYFLTCDDETEEEFIARTSKKKEPIEKMPKDCCEFLVNYGLFSAFGELCPDETKSLLFVRKLESLDKGHGVRKINVDNIMIIDRQKNNDSDKVIYTEKLDDYDRYHCCALSRGGSMIAMIYEEKFYNFGGGYCSYGIYAIKKVATQEKRILFMPAGFVPKKIAFNKQGTHLIAHGEHPCTKEVMHKITPLKIIDPMQVKVTTTNRLQEYLRDKCVCSTYIEGKK